LASQRAEALTTQRAGQGGAGQTKKFTPPHAFRGVAQPLDIYLAGRHAYGFGGGRPATLTGFDHRHVVQARDADILGIGCHPCDQCEAKDDGS
jgi:hypothetical protein